MGVGLDRIVKRVPPMAVAGVIMAVTVLAWGELYPGIPAAVRDTDPGATSAEPSAPADISSSPLAPSRPELAPSGDGFAESAPDCASKYPNLKVCSQLSYRYMYGSEREALEDLKDELGTSNLRIQSPRTTTSGPCPGVGQHYNVRDSKNPRDYPASIVCCPCCDDDQLGNPTADRRCGIVYKQGCDNRRRSSDASCAE